MATLQRSLVALGVVFAGVLLALPFQRQSATDQPPSGTPTPQVRWRNPHLVMQSPRAKAPAAPRSTPPQAVPLATAGTDIPQPLPAEISSREAAEAADRVEDPARPQLEPLRPRTRPAEAHSRPEHDLEVVTAARPGGAPPADSALRHVLADGDSLPRLAERYLGDGERWQEIYAANRQQLEHPDLLPLGVELIIPLQRTAERALEEQGLVPFRP